MSVSNHFYTKNHDVKCSKKSLRLVWECLRPLRRMNYPLNTSLIQMTHNLGLRFHLDNNDAILLRQVDMIFERLLDENQDKVMSIAQRSSTNALLRVLFRSLDIVRYAEYRHGRFIAMFPDGNSLELHIGRWDASLIERLDAFLAQTYSQNKEALDKALEIKKPIVPKISYAPAAA